MKRMPLILIAIAYLSKPNKGSQPLTDHVGFVEFLTLFFWLVWWIAHLPFICGSHTLITSWTFTVLSFDFPLSIILVDNVQNAETDNFDDFGVDLYPIRKAKSSIFLNNKNSDAVRLYIFLSLFSFYYQIWHMQSYLLNIKSFIVFSDIIRRLKEDILSPKEVALVRLFKEVCNWILLWCFWFLNSIFSKCRLFRFKSWYNSGRSWAANKHKR